MTNLIYIYALLKSLNDNGKDYLDAFLPFALKGIPDNTEVNIDDIQKNLIKGYNLDIPQHVILTILCRVEKKGYITIASDKCYSLTDQGIQFKNVIENERDVNRRINKLIEDIRKFFSENKVELSFEDVQQLLDDFIKKNRAPLIHFLNPNELEIDFKLIKLSKNEEIFFNYITLAENIKPDEYSTLSSMVLGSLIYTVISREQTDDLMGSHDHKLKHCIVYFDTNFIFSLFELHTPGFNKPAQELYKLLIESECQMKIFDFSIEEITGVMNGFMDNCYRYPKNIPIDSIYSSLRQKGWQRTDAVEFITNIEIKLDEKKIKIESTPISSLINFKEHDENIRSFFYKYNNEKPLHSQNHDIAAIEEIKKMRGKDVRKLEESIAIFVTSDSRLSQIDSIAMNHNVKKTIPEVILDRILTNILWLQNPKLKISLSSIVAAYAQGLLINKRVWDRFYFVLQDLKKDGKISGKDIALLIYDNQLEKDLKKFDESQLNNISKEFVLDELFNIYQIEQQQKNQEIEKNNELEQRDQKFIEDMEKSTEEIKQEKRKNEDFFIYLGILKTNAKNQAKNQAKNIIRIFKITTILLISYIISIFWNYVVSNPIIPVILLLLTFGGIQISQVWEKTQNCICKILFQRTVETLGLDMQKNN